MTERTEKFQSKPFYCRIFGDSALFTDPSTKAGGEKFTYSVPTYEALRGIIDACYWKPTISNIIDECKIMNPIRTQTKGVLLPLNNGSQDRYYYTYLTDVCYEVKFHFIWNEDRPDLLCDRDEKKHTQILLRSLDRGGRRDIFLGARECIGYIERLSASDFEKANTAYENQQLDFGIQFHSFNYPGLEKIKSEAGKKEKTEPLISNFTRTRMVNGRIHFVRPEDCDIHHEIYQYTLSALRMPKVEYAEQTIKETEYQEGGMFT